MLTEAEQLKQAAIEQWTADPCGPATAGAEPGSRSYFDRLLAGREAYATWMPELLDYESTAGMEVLDVGCGQGIDLARYALAGACATGIDLTPRHVELARAHLAARGLSGTVVLGDAEQLPFADRSFDRVSSNGVIHHTPDIEAAIHEIHRVLRPGGEARLIVYNRNSIHFWYRHVPPAVLTGRLLRARRTGAPLTIFPERSSIGARLHTTVYTRRSLAMLMRAGGFEVVRTSIRQFAPGDAHPYALLARIFPRLAKPDVLDAIGRRVGWYVIGTGRRPAS